MVQVLSVPLLNAPGGQRQSLRQCLNDPGGQRDQGNGDVKYRILHTIYFLGVDMRQAHCLQHNKNAYSAPSWLIAPRGATAGFVGQHGQVCDPSNIAVSRLRSNAGVGYLSNEDSRSHCSKGAGNTSSGASRNGIVSHCAIETRVPGAASSHIRLLCCARFLFVGEHL